MAARKRTAEDASLVFLDPSMAPWVMVSEVYWMSYKLLERRFHGLGLSASQARVMAVIHTAGAPVKPSAIANVLFQETQSITGHLHRLEGRKWIVRAPVMNDRRAVGISLTEEGARIAREIDRISKELYQELFTQALTAAEAKSLVDALKKVRAMGFTLPETDFKLRRTRQYPIWSD